MTLTLGESILSSADSTKVTIASPVTIAQTCDRFLNAQNTSLPNDGYPRRMIRSASDNFDYKLLQLKNGIQLLLISDPSFKDLPQDKEKPLLKPSSRSKTSSRSHSTSSTGNDHLMRGTSESATDEPTEDESLEDGDEEEDDDYSGSEMEDGFGPEGESESGEKCSAIVAALRVGSFQDPADFPGMAHMLEHLMSMGCEEFPGENYLDDFLNSRGGDQNAFTEVEHTCYQIRVQRSFLEETINLVAKTFQAPLLRQSSIDREIEPIDSEFIEATSCDENRIEMILSHLSNSSSSLHRFLWGNTESLITQPKAKGLDTREAVLKWYAEHYRSDKLVFVIQSQEEMKNLEEWSKVFEEIPASSPSPSPTSLIEHPIELPFHQNDRFNKLYIVETAEVGSRLVLSWITKPIVDQYMTASFDFLATLIGYEGRGSLLSELKRHNLAMSLATNSNYFTCKINHHYSIFQVEIELTDHGAKNLDQIVSLIGEYLSVLRKAGTQEYFFRENQTIALSSFNNACEQEALQNAERLAQNILFYPVEHILIGSNLFYSYNPQNIDRMLDEFRIEKANFMLATHDFRPDVPIQNEPWMKTKFQELELPEQWRNFQHTGKSEAFFYPQPNRFIASNFDLISTLLDDSSREKNWPTIPQKILEDDDNLKKINVWYKPDFEFSLPKAKVYFHILSPCIEGNVLDETHCDIFCEMLLFELNEYCYDADLAQLTFAMSRSFNGIQLSVSGFNHKLPDLIFLIFERLLNFEPTESRLEMIKKTILKYYTNKYYDQDKYCTELRLKSLLEHYSTLADRSRIVDQITVEALVDYKQRLLSSIAVEMLIQGNITLAQSSELVKQIASLLNLNGLSEDVVEEYKKQNFKILKFPVGKTKIRRLGLNPKSEMNHVVCYYQLHEFNFESYAILSLFIDIAHELCFNYLRTKEGLGYSVGVDLNDTFGILGFNVQVTSPAKKFDCDATEAKIGQFVFEVTRQQLEEMSDEKYEEHLESLITRKKEKDVSLDEEVGRNMGEIMGFNYDFTRREKEIAGLVSLKNDRNRFLDWLRTHIWKDPSEVRQLNIEVVGLCDHSLTNVADWDGRPVQTGNRSDQTGDHVREVCLKSSCDDSSEYIQDFDKFKAKHSYFDRQPPTISLEK